MRNVYGYIRVSTAKQGEGVSLIAQKEAINEYASKFNLNITQWFEEKETAAKQGRPLFTTMMKLLQQKKAEGVIIHKIDRGARNLKDWADMGNLIDQGIEVHFAHESLDMQARGGRLSADIQAVIAADYIRNLRQEAIKGIYGRLQQGLYPFGAPLGYTNNGKGKCKTIDPVASPLVKQAFVLYASRNYSLETLSKKLYELGLRNKNGRKLHINNLSRLLNNKFYMGIIEIKGKVFNGLHEPLVSTALFKQVQDVLWGKTHQKIRRHEFTYRRLIECSRCGYSLTPEIQKGKIYYRCHNKLCATKGIIGQSVERQLLYMIAAIQFRPREYTAIEKEVKEMESNQISQTNEKLENIKLRLSQLKQRMERLTDCYVDGGLEYSLYESRKLSLLEEIKSAEEQEKEILTGNDSTIETAKKIFELAKTLTDAYKNGDSEQKRKLVQKISSNLVTDGKKLTMTMKIPFHELANRSKITPGAPNRNNGRIKGNDFATLPAIENHGASMTPDTSCKLVYEDMEGVNTIHEPLSKKQLKTLLNTVLEQVGQLSEDIRSELRNEL